MRFALYRCLHLPAVMRRQLAHNLFVMFALSYSFRTALGRCLLAASGLAWATQPAQAMVPDAVTRQVAHTLALVDPWMPVMLLAWLVVGAWSWHRVRQPALAQTQLRQRMGADVPAALPLRRWPAVVTTVCLLALALLSWSVAEPTHRGHSQLMAWDAAAQHWSQTHVPDSVRSTLRSITDSGDVLWLACLGMAVAAFLCWRRQWLALQVWVFAIGLNGLATRVLKNLFDRGRPEALHDLVTSGASFPSGHTAGAIVVYGLLYCLLRPHMAATRRLWLGGALAVLVALIACSRVWLEAHFATDVAAGALLGVSIVCIGVMALERGRA